MMNGTEINGSQMLTQKIKVILQMQNNFDKRSSLRWMN
ncbi:hypothetical protein ACZ87_03469 [Candidatus Erwinia dacicola]|uniref:Uncharacterized protein n=1 Tax=Candidatus Erwinia dacicola TaxID=252393 RepID=A0A328TGK9_9GAMM|nr:hypothetical protein ACZ87_03469 [Candidatus Erwinia dacicola]